MVLFTNMRLSFTSRTFVPWVEKRGLLVLSKVPTCPGSDWSFYDTSGISFPITSRLSRCPAQGVYYGKGVQISDSLFFYCLVQCKRPVGIVTKTEINVRTERLFCNINFSCIRFFCSCERLYTTNRSVLIIKPTLFRFFCLRFTYANFKDETSHKWPLDSLLTFIVSMFNRSQYWKIF